MPNVDSTNKNVLFPGVILASMVIIQISMEEYAYPLGITVMK